MYMYIYVYHVYIYIHISLFVSVALLLPPNSLNINKTGGPPQEWERVEWHEPLGRL